MKVADVIKCSFQNWYQQFSKVTMESILLPLPEGFVAYLLKDGIILPKSGPLYITEDASDSEEDWDDNDEDEPEAPNFPEFDIQIKNAIKLLGGQVFPKLNWSSPRDAAWILLNNICCCSAISDIYLLLKSSDFVTHDLTKMLLSCDDYEDNRNSLVQTSLSFFLVLRKWVEIDPSGEFRCFVKDSSLIGICQREHSLYFDHIGLQQRDIVHDIVSFFNEYIRHKFQCQDYVFDVFRKKKDEVLLIDFNPFGKVTEALLFDWAELDESLTTGDQHLPEFRYVRTNRGVQPRSYSYHAIPKDIVDISTGEDSLKFIDLMKLKIENNDSETDASEDERSPKV